MTRGDTRNVRTILQYLLPLCALALGGCPGFGDEEPRGLFDEVPARVNFAEHVSPISERYCNTCHGVEARNGAPPSLRLDTCQDSQGRTGARNLAMRITARIQSSGSPMPPVSASNPVSALDLQIIERWVACGLPCGPEDAHTCDGAVNNGAVNNGEPNNGAGALDFPGTALPIFTASCNFSTCHGAGGAQFSGLELTSLDNLLARGDLLKPCQPDQSALIQRLRESTRGFLPLMPQGGPELPEDTYQALRRWVEQGDDLVALCQPANNGEPNNGAVNNGAGALDFAGTALPIFMSSCNFSTCHGEGGAQFSGLELTSLDSLLAAGDVLVPCQPDQSELIQRLRESTRGDDALMPRGGPELPEDTYQALRRWVAQGEDLQAICGQTGDCAGVGECQGACARDSALECALECTQGLPDCRDCVEDGLRECGRDLCEAQYDAFEGCAQDCLPANDTVACLERLCQAQWDALDACLGPQIANGACDEPFMDCPLRR